MKELYREKSNLIEAVKYKGEFEYVDGFDFMDINGRLIKSMTLDELKNNEYPRLPRRAFIFMNQNGMQGKVSVEIGDYIIYSGNNKYIMNKDDFESNYEKVPCYDITDKE